MEGRTPALTSYLHCVLKNVHLFIFQITLSKVALRGHQYKISVKRNRLTTRTAFFSQRVVTRQDKAARVSCHGNLRQHVQEPTGQLQRVGQLKGNCLPSPTPSSIEYQVSK